MLERLRDGKIGVRKAHVFAHHGDGDVLLAAPLRLEEQGERRQVDGVGLKAQPGEHAHIEFLVMQRERNRIDARCIDA